VSKILSNKSNLQVLYEDNHIIIVNKRVGDIVQGDRTGDKPLSDVVKEYVKEKYHKPGEVFLGVVHRLDRPTSGIVMFARTSKALTRLNKLFSTNDIKKSYWAIVKVKPPMNEDTLTHYLIKNPKNNKSKVFDKEVPNSKKAILDYELTKTMDKYYLLLINLKTGRHHQIRAQLSSIGSAIKGDLKYGFDRSNKNGGIHLHARRIEFHHPVKDEIINITAPVPDDILWKAAEK